MDRRTALATLMAAGAMPWLKRTTEQQQTITRAVPATGETLPVIGMGTWQTFDVGAGETERAPLERVLGGFVRLGGRVIDSSPMYGRSEEVTGDLAVKTGLQSQLFVATKVWIEGEQKGIQQMEDSMRKLRVQKLDLLQVHNLVDTETHLRTLQRWKAEGRIRYIGITHYTVSSYPSLEGWLRRGGIDFVQFNYSLSVRAAEQRMLPAAQELGVAVLINRPFEEGEMFARVQGRPLPAWAAEIDCTSWAQVFLKYVASHPAVTAALPATSNPGHLEDNMQAGVGRLPDAALRRTMAEYWDRL